MSFPPAPLEALSSDLFTLLSSSKDTVSISETACGGLLSASILSRPGASKIYKGGLTLYTLPSRIKYAGWTDKDTHSYRGPTRDIVAGLAKRVGVDLGSTFCLAESGTAGPTGGNTHNRRPGFVALAVCERREGECRVWTKEINTGSEERSQNMLRFAEEGLRLLIQVVKGEIEPDETIDTRVNKAEKT